MLKLTFWSTFYLVLDTRNILGTIMEWQTYLTVKVNQQNEYFVNLGTE